MSEILEPGGIARRLLLRRVLGTGIMVVIGSHMAAAADMQVVIDNFTFSPTPLQVKAGTDGDMGQPRRHPPQPRLPEPAGSFASAGYQRHLQLRIRADGDV